MLASRPNLHLVTLALASFFCMPAPTQAAYLADAPSTSLTCNEVVFTAAGHIMTDRDTTGTGEETVTAELRDGDGTLLIASWSSTVNIGLGVPFGVGSTPYTTAPTHNPITLSVFSPAGNGLPEQVLYTVTGNCAGLPMAVTAAVPTMDFWGLSLLALAAGGLGAWRMRRMRHSGA